MRNKTAARRKANEAEAPRKRQRNDRPPILFPLEKGEIDPDIIRKAVRMMKAANRDKDTN